MEENNKIVEKLKQHKRRIFFKTKAKEINLSISDAEKEMRLYFPIRLKN
jgi:hypothetical protein